MRDSATRRSPSAASELARGERVLLEGIAHRPGPPSLRDAERRRDRSERGGEREHRARARKRDRQGGERAAERGGGDDGGRRDVHDRCRRAPRGAPAAHGRRLQVGDLHGLERGCVGLPERTPEHA